MNSLTIKFVVFFISLFVLVNVGSQIYLTVYNPYKYESAVEYAYEDTLQFTGVFLRDEAPVQYSGGGAIGYVKPDGSKVSAKSEVAQVYQSEQDIGREKQIKSLKQEIITLKASQDAGATDAGQLDTVNKQINETYARLITELDDSDYVSAKETRNDIVTLLNRLNIITGKEESYDSQIAQIQAQISTLQSQITSTPEPIYADHSGYFISSTDGYEYLTPDMASTLTIAEIEEIENSGAAEGNQGAIGKIVQNYSWKLIGIIDLKLDYSFLENTTVSLKIGSSPDYIPAVIESVSCYPDEGKAVILLTCERMNMDYLVNRTGEANILLGKYKGIRVPASAIRYNAEGEQGVYIRMGQTVFFRKIHVLFNGVDFVISEITNQSDYLSVFDEIVVEGNDLYDNKPIK